MKIVLYQPQIPQNTGNIIRTCAVTGCDLVLVRPMGFSIADRWLKRAGLDYIDTVNISVIDDLNSYLESSTENFYFYSSKAEKIYSNAVYTKTDLLVFGSETTGLPSLFQEKWPDKFLTLPMIPGQRCLNLATTAGIAVYEALRQLHFTF